MSAARSPRAPGFAFAGVSLVLFALVAVVALSAQVATPPAIAELAPQAAQELAEAAQDDPASEGVGSEPGGAGVPSPPPPTTPPPTAGPSAAPVPTERAEEVIEQQAVRKCIGDPPRQTEDPQSPPCVPYWKGDNGGATWRGVTGNEIKVAVGNPADSTTGQPLFSAANLKAYETFFNRRYEFYGRQLRLIPYTPARASATAVDMTNDAVKVDKEIGAFGAVMYSEQDGRQYVYFDALAQRKIVGVMTGLLGLSRADEEHMRARAPYQWDYTPSADRMFRGYGEFLCKQLVGRPPAYGGSYSFPATKRRFGILVDTAYKDTPPFDISPLTRALKACGEEPVVLEWDQATPPTTLLAKLKEEEVTSVMYTGQAGVLALRIMTDATAQNYFPEWLVWNLGYQDSDGAARFYPSEHADHILGLQVYNKQLAPEDMPYVWAAREVDPSALSSPTDSLDSYARLYASLLVLASGVQLAGPELTPQNMQRGLFEAQFPNPGAGGPPYYQGRVGFPGVHTMQQDMAMVWLSQTEPSPVTRRAPSFCYVQEGRRYGIGQWPTQQMPFRQPPCR